MPEPAGFDPALWRAAQQGLHSEPWQAVSQGVLRSSRALPWRGLWVWEQGGPAGDLYLQAAAAHCIIVRKGVTTELLQRQGGETRAHRWQPGEVLIVPAGTPSFWRSGQPRDNLHIDLAPQWLERAAGDRGPVTLASCFGRPDALLAQLAGVLSAALDDSSALNPGFGDAMAMAIAVHLVEHHARVPGGVEKAWALTARQLRRVAEHVREHPRGACDVATLAALVDLSPAHFSRCFKATAGVTPHRFVARMRLEHARELLLAGDMDVGEVARAVGYGSRAHFAQAFRRHWGVAPGEMRRGC